jgi:hypothetical protein
MLHTNTVVIIDSSILCVYLKVPGKETCGSGEDLWDHDRAQAMITSYEHSGATLVLPLASIIEVGNHIAKAPEHRFECAQRLGDVMKKAADGDSPWAAFASQSELWEPSRLRDMAETWPPLADQKLSLGDTSIKEVAEMYSKTGFPVVILTADRQLRACTPAAPQARVPRRRQR